MKTIERKQITRYEEVTTSHTCDICGCNLEIENKIGSRSECTIWMRQSHEHISDDVSYYPYDNWYYFDICPECFETKLTGFFAIFGSKPRVEQI